MIDWSQCAVVESDPEKMGGAWVFKGTRVPVAGIFENLQDSSMEEVLENFPSITREQIEAVLEYVAQKHAKGSAPLASGMKILLDESLPWKLRLLLPSEHFCATTAYQGWLAQKRCPVVCRGKRWL